MAINENANVNIELNTKPVARKIAELESKLDKLNEKKRQFEQAGDQKGLVRTQKEIDKVTRQLNNAVSASDRCQRALARINEAAPKELQHTLRQLKNDLNHMERGSDAWKAHVAAIKRVKAELDSVNAEMREHEGWLSRVNRKVNEWGMSIASAAAAFTGLIFTARQAVESYAEMEQEMANVRKFTGMAADEVEHMNEAFKQLDTRTSREDLNKLAQEAGRLGLQSEEDVLGFVRAADKINVALDDLGEGATLTLSKLTDIFGDRERLGTEQSLLAVGSVINELSQNCTASAPYLAQFAQRLAGVGKQANMTIPEIMGFAAVLDSQGQAVEMSATAVSQLIMKLFQDPAKIAKATGMDLQAFNKVLKEDTNEALLMLLERLNSLGNIDVLAPVFASMGTDGARASQVIAALAGNIDQVKSQQREANKAFKEANSIDKEFAVQNNTVAAGLDKAKKRFHEMAVELGQKLAPAMKYAISGTSAMMHVLSATVSFISDYAGTILSTAAAIGIYTVAVNASVIVDQLKVFWNEKVIASLKQLWKTIAANPYLALAAAIGVVIGYLIDLARHTNAQAEAEKALNNIRSEAKKKMVEEKQQIDILMAAAKNMNLTYDEQKAAVDKLNKIIPGFNGKIDKTTRAFSYSQTALKNYNDELQRLYELEGAKEKFIELGRKRADLMIKKAEIEEAKQREMQNVPTSPTPQTSSGAVAAGGVHQAMGHSATLTAMNMQLNDVNNELKAVDATKKLLIKTFGDDLQRNAVKQPGGAPPATPTSNITGGGGGNGGGGGHGGGGSTSGGNNDKPDPEAEAAKRMKAEVEKLTNEKNDALTKLNEQYRKGELKSEQDYVDKQHAINSKYYKDLLAIYTKYNQQQSKDATDARTKQAEEETKHDKDLLELKKKALEKQRDADKTAAQMRYYEPDSKTFHNQQALDDELAKIEIKHLEKVRDLYKEGTKERAEAEQALEKANKAEILRQKKVMDQNYQTWLYAYSLKGAKERMAAELAILEELHTKGKISETEYEQAKEVIRKKYRDDLDSKTGTSIRGQAAKDAELEKDQRLAYLEQAKAEGLVTEEEYQHRRWEIISNYHDKVSELVKGEGSEWATMVTDLVTNWQDLFQNLGNNLADILDNIGDTAAATFAVMNAGLQSYSNYAKASSELELAELKKKYEEDVSAKNLSEKQKEDIDTKYKEDEKRLKTKASKRAQKIEMAQAIASTALGAIRAYTSALEAGYPLGLILAPIAAGMALAAGAVQIATIKKQHQAERAGYYDGGFTSRDGNNRREVGVVHANEFVANHEAVENPAIRPLLNLIDTAQRNNTVGSLTADDVSRALGQGAVMGDFALAQQRAAAGEDKTALVVAAMTEQTLAVNELNARLAEGIESYMVMDGERGFDRYWERYQRMKNNPQR